MVEADDIILNTLEHFDCAPIQGSDEVRAIQDLTFDSLIIIVWKCLARIQKENPGYEFSIPTSMEIPKGVAAKHKIGSSLAENFKTLGYTGDCGYNNFLYPTEKVTRSLLSWLVAKLPRINLDVGDDQEVLEGSGQNLQRGISSWMSKKLAPASTKNFPRTVYVHPRWKEHELGTHLDTAPFTLYQSPVGISKPHSIINISPTSTLLIDNAKEEYELANLIETDTDHIMLGDLMKHIRSHPFANDAPCQPFQRNLQEICSDFTHSEEHLTSKKPYSVIENPPAHTLSNMDDMIEKLQSQSDAISKHLSELQHDIIDLHTRMRNLESELVIEKSRGQDVKRQLMNQRKTVDLLQNVSENIAKLEELSSKSKNKLVNINDKWKQHEMKVLLEEKAIMAVIDERKIRYRQMLSDIRALRSEIKNLSGSVDQKRLLREALEQKYENAPKSNSRNSYTTRIMDIIKQVHKQKQEIRKIMQDIRVVQKQINFSSEKLKRSEAVADEKLFHAAKEHGEKSSKGSSSTYVECYRYFAEVREVFEELILIVADIGKKENSIRDLENWISHLQTRESGKNLERVIKDLQVVRDENATLIKQLH